MNKTFLALIGLGFCLSACSARPQAQSVLIAGGGNHTCALSGDGGVKCWGSNQSGQLGNGTWTDSSSPVAVANLGGDIIAVAAGGRHSCALDAQGSLQCWGANDQGQLGDGASGAKPTPVNVNGMGHGILAIVAGDQFSCALNVQGGVLCWGGNEQGQLGNGKSTGSLEPVAVYGLETGISAIAAGGAHACALTSGGGVKCWGANDYGQLGNKTKKDSPIPVEVNGLHSGVAAITVGTSQSCALMTSGAVKCWGWNGDENQDHHALQPEDVAGLESGVIAVAAGAQHTCALTGDQVKCWGSNYVGQLGHPGLSGSSVPVRVTGLRPGMLAIASGSYHTCVLDADARVRCWGQNYQGELGVGNRPYSATPVSVIGLHAATFASLTATAAPTSTTGPTVTPVPPTLIPWATPTGPAQLTAGTSVSLVWVHMLDVTNGWGIDVTGHILRTTDGGAHWKCVTPATGIYDERSFFPVDANSAWAAALPVMPGSEGCSRMASCHLGATLWHTVDGGLSWQANKTWQASQPLARPASVAAATSHGLYFLDPATGWFLLEDWGAGTDILTVLARTSDNGQSLHEIWRSTGIGRYTGVVFVNKQIGYLGLDDTTFFDRLSGLPAVQDYLDGKQAPYLEKTDDGGYTWSSVFLPRLASVPEGLQAAANLHQHMLCGIQMLRLIAPQGIAAQVVCRVTGAAQPYQFYYLSPDAGLTWRSWLAAGSESFLDPSIGWRSDPAGQFQQTANGGLDWVTLGRIPGQTAGFDFIDQRNGWAIVTNGAALTLMHTTDGGHYWLGIRPTVANP